MALTDKQSRFVEAYIRLGSAKDAVVSAGYTAKNPNGLAVEANRLLKNPEIAHEIANWRKEKNSQLSKDDFVSLAIGDYKQLDIVEPNKPRFLDIAGKALGYIGNNSDSRPNQTLNVEVNLSGSESVLDLLANVRKLLGNS